MTYTAKELPTKEAFDKAKEIFHSFELDDTYDEVDIINSTFYDMIELINKKYNINLTEEDVSIDHEGWHMVYLTLHDTDKVKELNVPNFEDILQNTLDGMLDEVKEKINSDQYFIENCEMIFAEDGECIK